MTGRGDSVQITSVLYVDLGEGREIKSGRRAGQIQWTREPRARFECLLCRTAETPVVGKKESVPAAVARFLASIRDDHLTRCQPATQGAQAA